MKVWGCVCDAPARSFVTGTKGHAARNACPRCKTAGIYSRKPGKVGGRQTFPDIDADSRTHEEFIGRTCRDYHNLPNPVIQELNLDMVLDFPFDYMHLCCLGVMKKLLCHWKNRETETLLITHDDVAEISRRLTQLKIPSEFSRHPRSLNDLARWKATEYRQFLLYTGPVVLKDVLPPQLYAHFMLFHLAVKMLSSSETCIKYNDSCRSLLHQFIRESPGFYGGHFITYNVHCLIHLPEDVLRFGPIDCFSCFPFENFLFQLKKLIRNCKNPLVQLVKRLMEIANGCGIPSYQRNVPSLSPFPKLSRPHCLGPLLDDVHESDYQQFQNVQFKHWKLSIRPPNCYVLLKNEFQTVVTIENIIVDAEGFVHIIGYPFHRQDPFFSLPNEPELSNLLCINCVGTPSADSFMFQIEDIKTKSFLMEFFPNPDECENPLDIDSSFMQFPLQMEDKYM